MKRILLVAALVACSKSKQDAPPPPGSASGAKPVEPKPTPDAATPKTATGEDRAKQYDTCWSYFNDGKYDAFKGCFTDDGVNDIPGLGQEVKPDQIVANLKELRTAFPDIKGQPQLVLVSGSTVIGFALLTGTQQGPMGGPAGQLPATHNKIGIYMGAVIDTDDTGRAKRESDFFDEAEMLGQLIPDKAHPGRPAADKLGMDKVVVIAKDDDKEKANLAAYKQIIDAFNKHDVKAYGDLIADDVVWSELAEPKDQTKKDVVAGAPQAWKSMTDLRLVPKKTWAAGDYVASVESFEGTNDGPIADMGITKPTGKKIAVPTLSIYKLDGGKVKATWIFYQSLAMMMQLGVTPPPK